MWQHLGKTMLQRTEGTGQSKVKCSKGYGGKLHKVLQAVNVAVVPANNLEVRDSIKLLYISQDWSEFRCAIDEPREQMSYCEQAPEKAWDGQVYLEVKSEDFIVPYDNDFPCG